MTILQELENLTKENIKNVSDDILKIFHNEYVRRWTKRNKDKVNAYQREYYKKHRKNHNNIMNGNTDNHNDIKKASPLNVIGDRI